MHVNHVHVDVHVHVHVHVSHDPSFHLNCSVRSLLPFSPSPSFLLTASPQTGDDSHPSAAVEEILVTPDKLRDLDLDAFAEELERQVSTCVILTLCMYMYMHICSHLYVVYREQ